VSLDLQPTRGIFSRPVQTKLMIAGRVRTVVILFFEFAHIRGSDFMIAGGAESPHCGQCLAC
jgi:hypothetical protein